MTSKPILLLALCFALLASCSKEPYICSSPPERVYIRFLDENGEDLLNPANPNGYKIRNIGLHYMEDGKKTYSEVMLDSVPETKAYYLKTDISFTADKGRNFTLQLSPTVADNIYLRYDRVSENRCSFFRFVEFKYNGANYNLKMTDGGFRPFEIVK